MLREGRGGVVPPRPPQPQPKGSRLKATPTRRGSADFWEHLVSLSGIRPQPLPGRARPGGGGCPQPLSCLHVVGAARSEGGFEFTSSGSHRSKIYYFQESGLKSLFFGVEAAIFLLKTQQRTSGASPPTCADGFSGGRWPLRRQISTISSPNLKNKKCWTSGMSVCAT
jgi:hypothetical protein